MFDLKIVSSLEKILPKNVSSEAPLKEISALEGEVLSFQAVYAAATEGIYKFSITSDSDVEFENYFVKNVAVDYASHERAYGDSNYISHQPGLYPDVLVPVDRNWAYVNNIYHSIWITLKAKGGMHKVKIAFTDENNLKVCETEIVVNVVKAALPEQKLIFTQWFHTDCIADNYGYSIFSEELWYMVEKYLLTAHKNGINMILTPVFTPPLDTAVGGERPTVQLVGIKKTGEKYEFDFKLLSRWIAICKRVGFKYFEMPHLFTQWGAEATPKIVAVEDDRLINIFGWDVPFNSPEYENFLSCFLPALIDFLKEEGIFENTYFHISDEPEKHKLQKYLKAVKIAKKYLSGCKVIDAVSDFSTYQQSAIDIPVLATDHMDETTAKPGQERWCYYCNAQCIDVSNRFVAMPSARNRSIGVQMYKAQITGFLHWGYNFYYSRFSLLRLNPFYENDAYNAFPSGDSVSVYPGKNGPMPAIGLVVFNEALQDMRALQLLESSIGYEATVKFAEEVLGCEICFNKCFSAEKLLELREAVNAKISVFPTLKSGL